MEISNQFLHLWYQWTLLTAYPHPVNVVYQRYTVYRYTVGPVAGILTGLTTKEATTRRPPVQAQQRITPNIPMGIVRFTITSRPPAASEVIRGRFCQMKKWANLPQKYTICKRAVKTQRKNIKNRIVERNAFFKKWRTHFVLCKILDTPKNTMFCNSLLPINCKAKKRELLIIKL